MPTKQKRLRKKKNQEEEVQEEQQAKNEDDPQVLQKTPRELLLSRQSGNSKLLEIRQTIKWFDSGIPALNYAIGKGLPLGMMIELNGQEKSGKTTLLLHLYKKVTESEGLVFPIETEATLRKDRMSELGINLDNCNDPMFFETLDAMYDWIEKKLDLINSLNQKELLLCIGIDSLSFIASQFEFDGDYSKGDFGSMAKLTSRFCRRCIGKIAQSQMLFIIVTQQRMKTDGFGNASFVSPAGLALQYAGTTKLKTKKIKPTTPNPKGITVLITVENNKAGKPGGKVWVDIDYKEGVKPLTSVYYALLFNKKIQGKGLNSTYSVNGEKHAINRKSIEKLWEIKEVRKQMEKDLQEIYW